MTASSCEPYTLPEKGKQLGKNGKAKGFKGAGSTDTLDYCKGGKSKHMQPPQGQGPRTLPTTSKASGGGASSSKGKNPESEKGKATKGAEKGKSMTDPEMDEGKGKGQELSKGKNPGLEKGKATKGAEKGNSLTAEEGKGKSQELSKGKSTLEKGKATKGAEGPKGKGKCRQVERKRPDQEW